MARIAITFAAAFLALIPAALSQAPLYTQCGGVGWVGATTCVPGSTCVVLNYWYSQCLSIATDPGDSGTGTTIATSSPPTGPTPQASVPTGGK